MVTLKGAEEGLLGSGGRRLRTRRLSMLRTRKPPSRHSNPLCCAVIERGTVFETLDAIIFVLYFNYGTV